MRRHGPGVGNEVGQTVYEISSVNTVALIREFRSPV